jgi:outer membrane protein assembly factor BamB
MLTGKKRTPSLFVSLLLLNVSIWYAVWADDQTQWGQRYSRNMVSSEKGLPDSFDPDSAKNIKWVAELGTQTYSTPVVAGGKVLIGTNNENPRDARHKGDRAVLMCFNETDGSFCWQLVVPKVGGDPHFDWPRVGIVSAPTVEGDRAYVVSNRGEVMCLDLHGQANGNDGPYQDEGRHMAPRDAEPMQVTKTDADIIWLFDMPAEIGIHLHDETHSSILLHGQFLYLNSCNGINSSHDKIPAPDAPSLIVLDKNTGRLLAQDEERIGPRIFHCTWSSPALGEVNGQTLIFFCGGDGVCYAFDALQSAPAPEVVQKLKRVWRFDCDPAAPKEDVHKYIGNRNDSPSNVKSMPVFHNNRVYVTFGGDIWWGKHQAWLTCIDATGTGDITRSGQLWSYPLNRHCCSTPSVYDGLVFVADCGRTVHCVDADTGQAYWTHDAKGEMWACTLAADGKVYAATRRGDLWVLTASKEKQVISSIKLDSGVVGTPVAANSTLYIATMRKLYAVKQSVE